MRPVRSFSNLAHQLKEQNALDRMAAVLAEIPQVRKDPGYPPLVTPTSQIVGTLADCEEDVLSFAMFPEVKKAIAGKRPKPSAPSRAPQAM